MAAWYDVQYKSNRFKWPRLLLLLCLWLTINPFQSHAQLAQDHDLDSLNLMIKQETDGPKKQNLYLLLFEYSIYHQPENALHYEQEALELSKSLQNPKGYGQMLSMVGRIYWRLGKFEKSLERYGEAMKVFKKIDDKSRISQLYIFIGQVYADWGKYTEAKQYLQMGINILYQIKELSDITFPLSLYAWVYSQEGNFLESSNISFLILKISEANGDWLNAFVALSNLANQQYMLGNNQGAINLYEKCLAGYKKYNENVYVASTYTGMGICYTKMGEKDKALQCFHLSASICIADGDEFQLGTNYYYLGELYQQFQEYEKAIEWFEKAKIQHIKTNNRMELAEVLNQLGKCYVSLKDYRKAKEYFDAAQALSNNLGSKSMRTDVLKGREMLDSALGNWHSAYLLHKRYMQVRDSTLSFDIAKDMVEAQMNYEMEKKELANKMEQEKKDISQRNLRNWFLGGFLATLIFSIVMFIQRNKIAKARRLSDELLLNILPADVAEELKSKGETAARNFENVTVLFTDFVNFTTISSELSAEVLVKELNFFFKEFDAIISRNHLEKIKTIGDAYLAVGGLPKSDPNHAINVVKAALEIRDFIAQSGKQFQIRIGIHSGPVVAGIVGVKKYAYDIWGDTVNTASRMESNSEPGKVNISGSTYELIKNEFNCSHRGKISVKGKGEMDMYFVGE